MGYGPNRGLNAPNRQIRATQAEEAFDICGNPTATFPNPAPTATIAASTSSASADVDRLEAIQRQQTETINKLLALTGASKDF